MTTFKSITNSMLRLWVVFFMQFLLISLYLIWYLDTEHNLSNNIINTISVNPLSTSCNIDWNNALKFGSFYAIPSYYIKQGYLSNYTQTNAILSLGTLCDINRLLSAKQIAINFNGPISIAIYIDSIENEILKKTICNKVKEYFNDMNNKYDIHISILYPDYNDKYYTTLHLNDINVPFSASYPINTLRNLAVSQIKTKYVCVVDVDFIYMSAGINTINKVNNPFDDTNTVWIIPSFEFISYEAELNYHKHINTHNTYLMTKPQLLKYIKSNVIQPSHFDSWKPGHNCTNFNKWYNYNAKHSYMINYCNFWYEPYIIFKTEFAKNKYKWNDEYIGRGADKVQQITQLAHSCFKFTVMSNLFIIHDTHIVTHTTKKYDKYQRAMTFKYKKYVFETYCWNQSDSCISTNVCNQLAKKQSTIDKNEWNEIEIKKFQKYLLINSNTTNTTNEKLNLDNYKQYLMDNRFEITASQSQVSESKCLIIFFGLTRAAEFTYKSFKKHLMDAQQCDLALSVGIDNDIETNPFYSDAKYIWIWDENQFNYMNVSDDKIWELSLEYMYKMIQNEYPNLIRNNISYIQVANILSELFYYKHGSTRVHLFFRQFTYFKIKELNLLDKYDYFLYTRSDYKYICHFPFNELTKNRTIKDRIWVGNSEDWGGLQDRNLLTHKSLILNALNVLIDIFTNYKVWNHEFEMISNNMLSDIQKANHTKVNLVESVYSNVTTDKRLDLLNPETILKQHLIYTNIWNKVVRYDQTMYLVRGNNTFTRWSVGRWDQKQNLFIKYAEEYRDATKSCFNLTIK